MIKGLILNIAGVRMVGYKLKLQRKEFGHWDILGNR